MAVRPKSDTIAAIATAAGTGGIGIIRLSGPAAPAILRQLFVAKNPRSEFPSHKLCYGKIITADGQVLDEALAVHMHAPHTYTREDVVELHCHGSHLVLRQILHQTLALGARPADPGEFTKRAFLAGRIDLTRAEAVLDLLQAHTDKSTRLAVNQLQGALADALESIRRNLISILALLEVAIDFPEDDVELFDATTLGQQLQASVIDPLERLIAQSETGRILREGVSVVIAGRPNVGKSSLLNTLLREDRALVTPQAGTTRDTIEEMIDIRGIPIHLVDTAGIRTHENPIEAMGIERARQKVETADLILFLIDGQAGPGRADMELYDTLRERPHLVVVNKRDVAGADAVERCLHAFGGARVVTVSARTGQGVEELQEAVAEMAVGNETEQGETLACAPNVRHRAILDEALAAGRRCREAMRAGVSVDLLAVDVQAALDHLGDIIGLTTPDDVLDEIFSRFCIGK